MVLPVPRKSMAEGVTASSHCGLTPTNASAVANIATTYIGAVLANTVTIKHAPIANMTYSVLCSAN